MRFMILFKANADSEAGAPPSEQMIQMMTEMGAFTEEMARAGVLLAGEGLHPSSRGVRVRFDGTQHTVTEGPFAPTEELLAAFWLVQVQSRDEAVEWVKRIPNLDGRVGEVEIRPLFDADDFAPSDSSGELRAAEERLRAQAAGA